MLLLMSFPDSESVRAITRLEEPRMSHARRVAFRRLMCSEVGTRTLPAWWPHCEGAREREEKGEAGSATSAPHPQLITTLLLELTFFPPCN